MTHFPLCEYGPFKLRGLLRARMLPGERLIGWSSASEEESWLRTIVTFALGTIPVVGIVMATLVDDEGESRLIILTDRRLMALEGIETGARSDGQGVVMDEPVELMSFRKLSPKMYEIKRTDGDDPVRFHLHAMTSPPALRLKQALETFAAERASL